jgi:hypothetical protein
VFDPPQALAGLRSQYDRVGPPEVTQWRKDQKLICRIFDAVGVFHAPIAAFKGRPQPLLTSVVFTMQTARFRAGRELPKRAAGS